MSDLIIRLDQLELCRHAAGLPRRWMMKLALAQLEEMLDHVLHALVDHALVQDRAQPLEDGVESLRRELVQRIAALCEEGGSNFH